MKRFIDTLTRIERFIASFLVGVLTILVITDVLAREVANDGIVWAQKTSVYMMIWAGFLGAILVSQKAAHLRPEIGDKLWGEKGKHLFIRVQNFVTLAFCAFFVYAGFKYVAETYEFGDKSVVLNIKLWLLQIVIPYTFFSMCLRNIYFIIYPDKQLEMKRELS